MNQTNFKTQRLTTSAAMLGLSTAVAAVCGMMPFLNLPFGGGYTIASMLPIIIVSYMFGVRWGIFTSMAYSLIQILMDLYLGKGSAIIALFTPNDESFMGYGVAVAVILIDYLLAYTLLGFGGVFRNKIKNKTVALVLGTVLALTLRYCAHVVSGYIFYGAWAEWFFSQENFYAIGDLILKAFHGKLLSLVYSIFYNGLYMVPEIIITSIAAAGVSIIPHIKKIEE